MIFGPVKVSSSTDNPDGQRVLISSVIQYGINPPGIGFSSFAQLRSDGDVPYVIFNPIITDDYSSYEWFVTRRVGRLAFPHYIFFKNIVTNQARYTYYLCPDNVKLMSQILTLGNMSSLNVNSFQGFDFVPDDRFDYTPGILSGVPKYMISVSSVSGLKRISLVVAPFITRVVQGQIPTTWINLRIAPVEQYSIFPSIVYNRKDCSEEIRSMEIIARYTAGTISEYCSSGGYTDCVFYSNLDMCRSGLTFSNCQKGIRCGTDNCFGSCFEQNVECKFTSEGFSCTEVIPPQPNPPNPNIDYTYLTAGIISIIVIIVIIVIVSAYRSGR